MIIVVKSITTKINNQVSLVIYQGIVALELVKKLDLDITNDITISTIKLLKISYEIVRSLNLIIFGLKLPTKAWIFRMDRLKQTLFSPTLIQMQIHAKAVTK